MSSDFATDLRAALRTRPHSIAPKYFYDAAGSALFDRICTLPEYYPTRTELGLLAQHAAAMAALIGPDAELVEFGAGSATKVRLLLAALERPRCYVPIDISVEHLHASCALLRADFPGLEVRPLAADFTQAITLPAAEGLAAESSLMLPLESPLESPRVSSPAPATRGRVGFFPGSSIGNFAPLEAREFLQRIAPLLSGGGLLIGVDLVKSPQRLHAAYNDAAGVTAAFNLNLLARANRELGADFVLEQFDHYAFYEPRQQRIEMHLVSRRAQSVRLLGEVFELGAGESLHTENSYKYTVDGFRALAEQAGYTPAAVWCDAQGLFSLHWLVAPA